MSIESEDKTYHYYKLEIEYKGTDFKGWQFQPGMRTVQSEVERALKLIHRHTVRSIVAGRTDSGVHAKGQVVSYKTDTTVPQDQIVRKLNGILDNDIAIKKIEEVDESFSARFSAIAREYEYLVTPGKSALFYGLSWQTPVDQKLLELNRDLEVILGEHDFKSFCPVATKLDHYRCYIEFAYWDFVDPFFIFKVKANRFVHNMVRILVGTCVDIYFNKLPRNYFEDLLELRDRDSAGKTAPPWGLYLKKVHYKQL